MSKGDRPEAPLILSDDERQKLDTWASRPKSTQRLAMRAKIVLACAEGLDNKAVAARLRVNAVTVGKWRQRFLEGRLEGLADEPRPGAPRTITDARVEEVVTRTLEEKPKAATHWSTRGMAEAVGLLTCSPQTGPSGMRVILAHQGRRTFDEAYPPLARADHPQAP